jgi:predicted transcriptional regulator of viral defense system
MQKYTNTQVENRQSGKIARQIWAIIWDKKEINFDHLKEKGFNHATITKALDRMMAMGVVERVQRGLYKVSDSVVKG